MQWFLNKRFVSPRAAWECHHPFSRPANKPTLAAFPPSMSSTLLATNKGFGTQTAQAIWSPNSVRRRHPAHFGPKPHIPQQINRANKQMLQRDTRKRQANPYQRHGVLITKFISISIKRQALTSSSEVSVAADAGHQMVKSFQNETVNCALLVPITPGLYFAFLN